MAQLKPVLTRACASLRPPSSLIGRVRWVLLVLATANAAAVLPLLYAAHSADWSWWSWLCAPALLFAVITWFRAYATENFSFVDDVLVACSVYIVAVVSRQPTQVGLFYTGLLFASFYGSWRRTLTLAGSYAALYLTALGVDFGTDRVPVLEAVSQTLGMLLSATTIHFVAETFVDHHRSLTRENALRDGGAALLAATSRDEIYKAAMDALESMLIGGPRVSMKITSGESAEHRIVAVRRLRPDRVGEPFDWRELPTEALEKLQQGRAVSLQLSWEVSPDFAYFHDMHPGASFLFVIPLIVRGRIGGAIWVSSSIPLAKSLAEGSEALAAEIALAIEKSDLTESLRESEARFRYQALHDPLTELANRTLFRDRVEMALRQRREQSVAALFLDMDDFKSINDSLGHDAGDALLRVLAERLISALRPEDTVARLGGDEFAILLEGISSPKGAIRVAERILALFKKPIWLNERPVSITTTIGISIGGKNQTADELLRNADVAMYAAKQRQKGSYQLFETNMHARLVERIGLEADLREALDRGQFRLHFQPTINLRTGRIGGVEVLIRWQHPTRGWIPPLDFIPKAEDSGLIVPIGRWVLAEACSQVAEWRRQHGEARELDLSVNLSARQLQDASLVRDVEHVLAYSGLDPRSLILEITESTLMADVDAVNSKIEELRALGVRIAIDDFGIGYSSLGYLRRFPIDIMKIDKSFVDGLRQGEEQEALFHAILGLADALSIEAVAEGVEHPEQVERLHALGCAVAQGFYFSRPIDAEAMGNLLSRPVVGELRLHKAGGPRRSARRTAAKAS